MRIKKIHINGYGIFSDFTVVGIKDGLTLFIGDNEAGKSTLMSFIREVLFGFQSSGRRQYNPLHGGNFGGSLELHVNPGGLFTVDRGEGPRGGQVSITDANGSSVSDEFLRKRLGEVTEDVYKNIFAFGLSELQDFKNISSDDIHSTIYSAGLGAGAANLPGIYKTLDNKIGELYRTRGQCGIKKLLSQIDEVNSEIKSSQNIVGEYDEAVESLKQIEESRNLTFNRIRLIEQLMNAQEKISETAGLIENLNKEIESYNKEINGYSINDRLKDISTPLRNISRRTESYNNAERDLPDVKSELDKSNSKIESILKNLGKNWTIEKIESADISVAAYEIVNGYKDKLEKTGRKIEFLEKDLGHDKKTFNEAESDKKEAEENYDKLKSGAKFSKDELERRVIALSDLSLKIREREKYQDKAEYYTESKRNLLMLPSEKTRPESKPSIVLRVVSAVAALITVAIGFFLNAPVSYLLFGIAFIFGAIFAFTLYQTSVAKKSAAAEPGKPNVINNMVNDYDKQIEGLERKLESKGQELSNICEKLGISGIPDDKTVRDEINKVEREKEKAGKLENAKEKLDDALKIIEKSKKALDDSRNELESAKTELDNSESEWNERLKTYALDEELSPDSVLKIFDLVDKAKSELELHKDISKRILEMEETVEQFENEAAELLQKSGTGLDPGLKPAAIIENLLDELKVFEKQTVELSNLKKSVEDKNGQLLTQKSGLENYINSRSALISELKNSDNDYPDSISEITGSLSDIIDSDENELQDSRFIIEKLKQELESLKKTENRLHEDIVKLKVSIENYESFNKLDENLLKVESLTEEMNIEAGKWASLKIARLLLDRAKHKYEEERQPDILKSAGSYFNDITGGRYARIIAPVDEDTYYVTESSGERKDIKNQLSRGTAEEIYFSVRLGLISEFSKRSEPLPVIMDDIFVNMDDNRAPEAVRSLKNLLKTNQVIVFTCHSKTAGIFQEVYPDVSIIRLEDGKLKD